MVNINSYQELKDFLKSRSGLRMSHIYKPVMLLTVLRYGGKADKLTIASEFALNDTNQVDYYARKIVHPMPGRRLVRDGLLEKKDDTYYLAGPLSGLTTQQRKEVESILVQRINDYLDMRNPYGDSNLDAVPGSVRYEVLKRAKGRCEACGVSARKTQIDVDHIVPRAKGGSNDITNLQALCRTCNAQKRDRDDTNFIEVQDSYDHREKGCIFCRPGKRKILENDLVYIMEDKYPVTKGHSLIIPKRHVADYFDLYMPERNAVEDLLHSQQKKLLKTDASITGFNIGVNVGATAGQTVFHVHVHLIPRRNGDVTNPRGGIRHVIPGKGDYKKP